MITLYDYELSGNCYKIRLMLSILGLPYETEDVEFFPSRQHKSDAFLRINPLGQLPALRDGDLLLRDAQAILVYLATRYDASRRWYPVDEPETMGKISMWLAFADGLTGSISAARLHDLFFYEFDVVQCRARAHQLLRILDEHLWFEESEGRQWLCTKDSASIADIACFPYVMLADEGGISLIDYPAVRRWTDRVKRVPGFVVMAGIFPASPALEDAHVAA
jgi:glutathione S-transferase